MARRRWLQLGLAVLLLGPWAAAAGTVDGQRIDGVAYAPADAVARALGDIIVSGRGSLTWRSARGTLTVFDGSPDALWQADGAPRAQTMGLSAPVALRDGRWWLPLDALDTLGVRRDGADLVLPDGETMSFRLPPPPTGDGHSRVDELGDGVIVLRLFPDGGTAADAASRDATAPVLAAMLTDLDMLPLIDPTERGVIDRALEGTAPDKPLLVVVTALRQSAWQPSFTLSQRGRSLEFRYPYRMRLVDGSSRRVGPGAAASLLLLLPDWFDLYRPITVSWQGVTGSVTFRR